MHTYILYYIRYWPSKLLNSIANMSTERRWPWIMLDEERSQLGKCIVRTRKIKRYKIILKAYLIEYSELMAKEAISKIIISR